MMFFWLFPLGSSKQIIGPDTLPDATLPFYPDVGPVLSATQWFPAWESDPGIRSYVYVNK